ERLLLAAEAVERVAVVVPDVDVLLVELDGAAVMLHGPGRVALAQREAPGVRADARLLGLVRRDGARLVERGHGRRPVLSLLGERRELPVELPGLVLLLVLDEAARLLQEARLLLRLVVLGRLVLGARERRDDEEREEQRDRPHVSN